MNKKEKKQNKEEMVELGVSEEGEDNTKYGEFISTYFGWISLNDQKKIVNRLEDIDKEQDSWRKQ